MARNIIKSSSNSNNNNIFYSLSTTSRNFIISSTISLRGSAKVVVITKIIILIFNNNIIIIIKIIITIIIYIYIRYTNMFPSRKWAELNHGSSGWGRLLVRGERDSATRRMHRMSGVCENVWCIEFVSTLAHIYIYILYLIICWCSYYNPSHIYIYKCI